MSILAELQRDFSRAIISGSAPTLALNGMLSLSEAIQIHRNTVMGALTNALRVSYPTVEALVGETFFDQAGCIFVEMHAPKNASLALYGAEFAQFLSDFTPLVSLPYLADVARLDWAIEQVTGLPIGEKCFVIDAAVSIALPISLTILTLRYPAHEIRAALGKKETLSTIDLTAAEHFVLVWREGRHAFANRIGSVAGRFLQGWLTDGNAESALSVAMTGTDAQDALLAIQSQVFAAPFCSVYSTSEEFSL